MAPKGSLVDGYVFICDSETGPCHQAWLEGDDGDSIGYLLIIHRDTWIRTHDEWGAYLTNQVTADEQEQTMRTPKGGCLNGCAEVKRITIQ